MTSPLQTLIDLAAKLRTSELEAALNEAVKEDLLDTGSLRTRLCAMPRQPGRAALRRLVERHDLRLTDSELERRFLRLVRAAGLPLPLTQEWLNGFRVDFYWPDLGIVVETDGLRFHRSPSDQARDRRRDQAHAAAGLVPLRFTHAQVYYGVEDVARTLIAVAERRRLGVRKR